MNLKTEPAMDEVLLSNKFCSLKFKADNDFFDYCIHTTGRTVHFSYPIVEIEGETEQIHIDYWRKPIFLEKFINGVSEYVVRGISLDSGICMNLFIHTSDESPVIRFRYELLSELPCWLTKNSSKDNITYFGVNLIGFENFKEVRFSELNTVLHSSHFAESEINHSWFESCNLMMGPMFISSEKNNSFLIAYEHDSLYPERFLQFQLNPVHSLDVKGVKSNHLHNQIIRRGKSFRTVWFEVGGIAGGEEILAAEYRNFSVKFMEKSLLKPKRA
jgi:hypothetical protein